MNRRHPIDREARVFVPVWAGQVVPARAACVCAFLFGLGGCVRVRVRVRVCVRVRVRVRVRGHLHRVQPGGPPAACRPQNLCCWGAALFLPAPRGRQQYYGPWGALGGSFISLPESLGFFEFTVSHQQFFAPTYAISKCSHLDGDLKYAKTMNLGLSNQSITVGLPNSATYAYQDVHVWSAL